MLPKHQKLTGKEINYMLKRGKRYYGEYLIFRVIPQYSSNKFSQRAFQISLKVEKRASMRNELKRICFSIIQEQGEWKKHIKVFASVNKKKAEELKELIATQPKKTIINQRKSFVKRDLKFLSWKL